MVCSVCSLQNLWGFLFEDALEWPLQFEVQRSAAVAVVLCRRCRATKGELKHGESHDPPSARERSRGRYDVNK